AYLFHPIPAGFHRVSIQALVDEGGGELMYTLVDRELTHSLGQYAARRGVTRIQCTHSSGIQKPDWEEQVFGNAAIVMRSTLELASFGARAQYSEVKGPTGFGGGTGIVGAGIGAGLGFAEGMYRV